MHGSEPRAECWDSYTRDNLSPLRSRSLPKAQDSYSFSICLRHLYSRADESNNSRFASQNKRKLWARQESMTKSVKGIKISQNFVGHSARSLSCLERIVDWFSSSLTLSFSEPSPVGSKSGARPTSFPSPSGPVNGSRGIASYDVGKIPDFFSSPIGSYWNTPWMPWSIFTTVPPRVPPRSTKPASEPEVTQHQCPAFSLTRNRPFPSPHRISFVTILSSNQSHRRLSSYGQAGLYPSPRGRNGRVRKDENQCLELLSHESQLDHSVTHDALHRCHLLHLILHPNHPR